MSKVDDYLELLLLQEGVISLNEADVDKIVTKIEPKGKMITTQMRSALNPKKPKESLMKIDKLISFIPKLDIQRVDKSLTGKMKDYKKMKQMSMRVIENSLPNVSRPIANAVSSLIVVTSAFKGKNENTTPNDSLKKNLKELVMKTRKFADDFEADSERGRNLIPPEYISDIAVALSAITIAISILMLVYTGGVALHSGILMVFGAIAAVTPFVVAGLILMFVGIVVVAALGILKGKK